jgi:hypothetical protein
MPNYFGHSLRSPIGRVWRDERGVSAIMVALSLTVLVGFAGLGVETGLWYSIKRQNQSADAAAALSAAYEVLAGPRLIWEYTARSGRRRRCCLIDLLTWTIDNVASSCRVLERRAGYG